MFTSADIERIVMYRQLDSDVMLWLRKLGATTVGSFQEVENSLQTVKFRLEESLTTTVNEVRRRMIRPRIRGHDAALKIHRAWHKQDVAWGELVVCMLRNSSLWQLSAHRCASLVRSFLVGE
jgi:hypothetical protein